MHLHRFAFALVLALQAFANPQGDTGFLVTLLRRQDDNSTCDSVCAPFFADVAPCQNANTTAALKPCLCTSQQRKDIAAYVLPVHLAP